MTKFRALATAGIATALSVCLVHVPAHAEPDDLGCAKAIAAVAGMRANLVFPPYFSEEDAAKQGGEFDPNRYFEAFPHLKMQDGYTLDYVYHQDGMGGYPLLYARPVGQAPYLRESEFAAHAPPDYLRFVIPQDSPEGYFEYAAFSILAAQFYLFWHANYNDLQVLCGGGDVERLVASLGPGGTGIGTPMTEEEQQRARAIGDQQPAVVLTDGTATVELLVFTNWGGFSRRTLTIDRADHSIQDKKDEPLVEYDCGLMF